MSCSRCYQLLMIRNASSQLFCVNFWKAFWEISQNQEQFSKLPDTTVIGLMLWDQILEPGCRDLFPFSHKSISEVQHWRCVLKPGSQSAFQFIPKVLDEVRAICRLVKFFHTKLGKPFLYWPHSDWGAQVDSSLLSKNELCAVALKGNSGDLTH